MDTAEIIAALQAIIDAADGRELTDDEVSRYEALEGQLAAAEKRSEIEKRHALHTTAVNRVTTAAGKPEDQLDRAFMSYLRTGVKNADLVELRAQEAGEG